MGSADEVAEYQEPSVLTEKDVAKGELDEVPIDEFTGGFSENTDHNDQMAMKRLGKQQQFKVGPSGQVLPDRNRSNSAPAQFQLHLDARFHLHLHGHMGAHYPGP